MSISTLNPFLCFFFLILTTGLSAQHTWTRTNPGGGGAIAMVGATKSGLIVAGSDLSGVYTSANNGASWNTHGVTNGLSETHVSSLGFHPIDGNTFIIGTGIGAFKTTDGGQTIYPVNIEIDPSRNLGLGYVESIGMAVSDPNVGYLAHYEWWLPGMTFLKTTDAGENWTLTSASGLPSDARIVKILVDENMPNIVYALTGKARFACSDAFLYRSTDSGESWTRVATGIGHILDFDLHPTDPNIIYASTFEMHSNGCSAEMWQYANAVEQTYKSTNAGASFSSIFTSMSGIISVGTNDQHISIVDVIGSTGTWKTTDGGINWTNSGPRSGWFNGWANDNWAFVGSFNGYNKTVIKDRFNPDRLYGALGQWAWSSIDGGDHLNNISTTEVTPDHFLSTGLENVEGNSIDVNDSDPNSIYIGAYDIGFWYSKNHGQSWKKSLPDKVTYADYSWWDGGGSNCNFVLSDPDDASIVWAAFSADQPETKSAIFKSTNSGENWVMSNTGLNNFGLSTHGLSIDVHSSATARTMYVTQEGDVWKSVDGGASWTEIFVNGGLKFTEVDKFNSQLVYAGGDTGFFRSIDGGGSWAEVGLVEMRYSQVISGAQMRPDIVPETDSPWSTIPLDSWQGVFEIKADPNIADRVYVIAHGAGKGLYKSDDAGLTWTKLYTNDEMRGVSIAPGNSNIIYASSSANYHSGDQNSSSLGILISGDAGATWNFANDGMAWTNGGRMEVESGAVPHVWVWVPGTGLQYAEVPNFGPLPVSVLSPFYARIQDDDVILRWETSSELNNEGFEVSRSQDGVEWKTLGFVNSRSSKKYSLLDHEPFQGVSYYKLTQRDYDGQTAELGIISVSFSSSNPPRIYPNPTTGIVNVDFAVAGSIQDTELRLYDKLGRLLLSPKQVDHLDISSLPQGLYYLGIYRNGAVFWESVVKE